MRATNWRECVLKRSDADHDLCSSDVLGRMSFERDGNGVVSLLGVLSRRELCQSSRNG